MADRMTKEIADNGFLGVYMHKDGPIHIDRSATAEDLLKVIAGLRDELTWWKNEARSALKGFR